MTRLTAAVRAHVEAMPAGSLPAYVYDLDHLRDHVAFVRAALPGAVELYYATKANPEPALLRVLAGTVQGFDVSSGGELEHVRRCTPGVPLAFSGPGKTASEIADAVAAGVDRFHVESTHELATLRWLAEQHRRPVSVLLRVNLPVTDGLLGGGSLAMGGGPSPFGLDPTDAEQIVAGAGARPGSPVSILGVHTHLASGLDVRAQVAVAEEVLSWASAAFARHGVPLREVNLGGGMAVDYGAPESRYDWPAFGSALGRLAEELPGTTLRIEPGRSLTAYSGWYATEVVDVKGSRHDEFAVVRGGTHHLRTPAAKCHDQPGSVLPVRGWPHPWPRPAARGRRLHLVGQLCTPKDVLSRAFEAPDGLRAGDRVVLAMAGAYAWNISHQTFLMHPPPTLHLLDRTGRADPSGPGLTCRGAPPGAPPGRHLRARP